MKKFKYLFFSCVLTIALSLIANGCSSTTKDNNATDKNQSEQVLRVARDWENTNMDPATWSTHTDLCFGPNVFETLLAYDNDLNPSPKLAEKWEMSSDGLTYRFFLKKGVQFHKNYGEMKASDVVFTIERMKDPAVKATANGPSLGIDNMKEVTAEDDYTVKIVLKKEDPIFLYRFCEAYCYVISEKAVKEMGLEDFAKHPIGTGPFEFDKGIGGEKTEIVKNDKYWGEKAKLDRIIFNIISEPSILFNAFESGEIDFTSLSDSNKIVEYKNKPNFIVHAVPTRYTGNLGMNTQIKPFDDIKVRQAVACAINREEIVNNYFLGLEKAPDSIIPPGAKYAVKDNFKPEFNPEKAKKLLAEAGYPNGFETEIYCPNDQISMGPTTLIQSYLSQVGINAVSKTVDFGVFLSTARAGKAPLWYLCDGPEVIPDAWFERFTSSKAPGSNWSCFKDIEYDDYVKQALQARNENDKAKFYALAQQRLVEQLPFIPINTSGAFYAMNKKIKGFEIKPNLIFTYEKIYIEE
ncbi:ABC transporter substrate-binding protein [Tepidanaerobacter syntrophicus]|uniref:ABC transporter substrate-binding protein n=1 Tax=Tepidanaerobacter syntrophicus TaxID=224999 RepID=UPI00235B61A2|nr:ABC transporter substrate-binding protein [Tepidanaerobacter syntrophicus]